MGEQTDQPVPSPVTMGTFEETARSHLKRTWSATPAQRLAWLEEAINLAQQAGALPLRIRHGHFSLKKMDQG